MAPIFEFEDFSAAGRLLSSRIGKESKRTRVNNAHSIGDYNNINESDDSSYCPFNAKPPQLSYHSCTMPTHKGIKLSVASQLELKIHPEFMHPESSQFTFRSPDLRKSTISDWTPPSASSDSKADRLLGRQSMVSVYIPSVPGKSAISWYHMLLICRRRSILDSI